MSTDSILRASLIELDLPTATPATRAPAPVAAFVSDAISQPARDLALSEASIVNAHGFTATRSQLFFDEGTSLMKEGVETLEREALKTAKLPDLDDAATTHGAMIKAEQRKTSEITLGNWRLDIDGLFREVEGGKFTKKAIKIADHAIKQAAGFADGTITTGPNANTWLGTCDGTQRARAHTRRDGSRVLFALQGPESSRGYTEFDSDRVLFEAARQLRGMGLKADVLYSQESTRMTAKLFVQAPIDVPAFVGVGRVHQAGVIIRCADNGSLSIQVDGLIVRVRCMNATLVRAKGGHKVRVRHVGDVSRMGEAVRAALAQATAAVPELTNLWQRAAVEHYVDKASGTTLGMQEAFERLVAAGHLPKCGLGAAGAVEAYMSAWRAEDSPASAMGVVMAAQRAAHETSWKSQYAEDEVNEAASQMLYQPVYTLAGA